MKHLTRHWPVISIAAIIIFLSLVNYRTGMTLTGVDNLHPEFNFALNIKRSLFAAWQEYEGLGVLGGMGHASDLVRQLILWGLSAFIPTNLLRYVFTMGTLFIGATGIYYLIRKIVNQESETPTHNETRSMQNTIAFLGSLFYLFNLSTLQQYYTPFEVFTTHFAALPWLLLVTINYFQKSSKKNLWLLILTLILATPQGYVPTLFVVWLMATSILILFLVPKILKPTQLIHAAKYFALVMAINAFWLLPFAYFTLTNADVNVNAKINQMASENIFLLNKEFGNATDVMLLKGFWLQHVEPNLKGEITYSFIPWRNHMENPIIPGIGYAFFAVIILGLITSLKSKSPLKIGMTGIFFFSFIMLTTATPPFAQINTALREYIPLFKEVFRFPFTKFSILASLAYAVLFAVGIQTLVVGFEKLLSKYFPSRSLPFTFRSLSLTIIPIFFTLLLFIFILPAFKGELFYDRNRVEIPKEYNELFTYLDTKDPSARITTFPHNTFWDWKFYKWGYSGSGFIWYGIKQPILDRAFDMWGESNENYYHELSHALYAKNPEQFEAVLQKYHIQYLLIDKNIDYPPSPKALFFAELNELMTKMASIKKEKKFSNLELYKITLKDNPKSFIYTTSTLPQINKYAWNNNDQAYLQFGNYIATDTQQPNINSYIYPFRSLFSLKKQEEKEFEVKETQAHLEVTKKIPPLTQPTLFTIPSYAQKELIVPIHFETKRNAKNETVLNAVIELPTVWLGKSNVYKEQAEQQIAIIPQGSSSAKLTMNLHGTVNIPITPGQENNSRSFLSLSQQNILVLTDQTKNTSQTIVIEPEAIKSLPALQQISFTLPPTKDETMIKVIVPKIADNYVSFTSNINDINQIENCDIFRRGEASAVISTNNGLGQLQVQAKNATSCTGFYSPNLPHNIGYAIFITAEHKKGKGFHFWIVNEDEKFTPIDTYLPQDKKKSISTFILPPQDAFGKAYSFHLDSMSIGPEETSNTLHGFRMYYMPYNFMTSFIISNSNVISNSNSTSTLTKISHPNESLYSLSKNASSQPHTLVLSQSFDKAWKAYSLPENRDASTFCLALPFFCGDEVKNHVLINNWANGWILPGQKTPNSQQLIIVYLPQYLEYLGLVLLGGTIVGVLISSRLTKKSRQDVTDHERPLDE